MVMSGRYVLMSTCNTTGCGWPSAIIFDLDGTLIDSAPDLAGSLNTVFEQDSALPPLTLADVRNMIGAGVPKLIERGLRAHGQAHDGPRVEALVPQFMEIYLARATRETVLYPGGAEILKAYSEAGIKLGLCTNKPTDVSQMILRDLGVLDLFGSIVGGTSGFAKKPDPEPMMACMEQLGVIAARTVFVGDSIADVKTARNANLPVIVMSYGYTPIPAAELGGDVVIDRLDEIPQAIEQIKSA